MRLAPTATDERETIEMLLAEFVVPVPRYPRAGRSLPARAGCDRIPGRTDERAAGGCCASQCGYSSE